MGEIRYGDETQWDDSRTGRSPSGTPWRAANYNGYSQGQRRACTLHELGHAHRLAHTFNDQAMDDCPVCTTYYTSPQDHDRSDYHGIW